MSSLDDWPVTDEAGISFSFDDELVSSPHDASINMERAITNSFLVFFISFSSFHIGGFYPPR